MAEGNKEGVVLFKQGRQQIVDHSAQVEIAQSDQKNLRAQPTGSALPLLPEIE